MLSPAGQVSSASAALQLQRVGAAGLQFEQVIGCRKHIVIIGSGLIGSGFCGSGLFGAGTVGLYLHQTP